MLRSEPTSSHTALDLGRAFAVVPEALILLRGDRVEAANEHMVALLGHDPIGRPVRDLIADWREAADAEVPFEATLRGPGGIELPVEVRVRAFDIGQAAVSVRDARALIAAREAELALSEANTHLSYHDGLTGLANRQLFEETLTLAVERAKRSSTAVAVLCLDLDNFKLVNDSIGHHLGDVLLSGLAERLRTVTRDVDLVARQGGDEFLVLLADLEVGAIDEAARAVAGRVSEMLREPFDLNGTEFHARGSIGISVFPRDADDVVGLLKDADIAMYRAKRIAPGGHVFFSSDGDATTERQAFATRLHQALECESWVMHYQPLVDMADGRVMGAEALIRGKESGGGVVLPGEFISTAEELGLIEAIGDWVIDEVARQQREWRDQGIELEVSFNLSPRQLWTPNLAERLLSRLHDAGVAPSTVMAEITESTAMADPDRTYVLLRDLHSWGMRLALDDFGTGYSSLSRLKHMPVDVLKIDREFVRNVHHDSRLAGMVRAMIQVAQTLDMIPLAEGIETEDEYVFLRANGCRLGQGFWLAHPMPATEVGRLVLRDGRLAEGALPR